VGSKKLTRRRNGREIVDEFKLKKLCQCWGGGKIKVKHKVEGYNQGAVYRLMLNKMGDV